MAPDNPRPQDLETPYPLAAQIPLQKFSLPVFPPEASRLRSLTLTADIKLDEYQSLVQRAHDDEKQDDEHGHSSPSAAAAVDFNIPSNVPQSITALTLELFTLGFPRGFLSTLAASLPRLRSLTLFSCLVDGIDGEGSWADALAFFDKTLLLAELHVLDSFARTGFWSEVGGRRRRRRRERERRRGFEEEEEGAGDGGLRVVEVSYTYRGWEDEGFLGRVGGEEWAGWIEEGLVGGGFGLVPEGAGGDEEAAVMRSEEEEEKKKKKMGGRNDGVLPFAVDSRASQSLRRSIGTVGARALRELKMLDLTLWTLRAGEVGEVMKACAGNDKRVGVLVDLSVSVLTENDWWQQLIGSIGTAGTELEALEVVGVPTEPKGSEGGAMTNGGSKGKMSAALLDHHDLEQLASVCPKLAKLNMSILKARSFGQVALIKDEQGDWKEA